MSAPTSTSPWSSTAPRSNSEVWAELTRIPYGETISYGELARRVGRPKGPRAVGQANGRNPIPIIVPCHRVLASNGIGGYGGGLTVSARCSRWRASRPKVRRWKPPGVCATRST